MLRELLSIFRATGGPVAAMGQDFTRMLKLASENTAGSAQIYFGKRPTPEERSRIYEQDVQINRLERAIRKQVAAHLSLSGNSLDVPYCLLLMSLVKDVERIGDYAKNLSEVIDLYPDPLPEGDIMRELQEIRRGVEDSLRSAGEVFDASDRERALQLITKGRLLANRCEALVRKVAASDLAAGPATAFVLGIRYYKRIGGHVLNILSSVVMPLHKVDYYDEDELVDEDGEQPRVRLTTAR
jgi:phosphate uptake regulator